MSKPVAVSTGVVIHCKTKVFKLFYNKEYKMYFIFRYDIMVKTCY